MPGAVLEHKQEVNDILIKLAAHRKDKSPRVASLSLGSTSRLLSAHVDACLKPVFVNSLNCFDFMLHRKPISFLLLFIMTKNRYHMTALRLFTSSPAGYNVVSRTPPTEGLISRECYICTCYCAGHQDFVTQTEAEGGVGIGEAVNA